MLSEGINAVARRTRVISIVLILSVVLRCLSHPMMSCFNTVYPVKPSTVLGDMLPMIDMTCVYDPYKEHINNML